MSNVEANSVIFDEIPWFNSRVTNYGERHFIAYRILLDAKAAGSSGKELSRTIVKINTRCEREPARPALADHLYRAQQTTEIVYRLLSKLLIS